MNNFIAMFVAMLEHLELLTKEEAKALAKDLQASTLPDTYDAASKLLGDLYAKHEIQKLRHKIDKFVDNKKS